MIRKFFIALGFLLLSSTAFGDSIENQQSALDFNSSIVTIPVSYTVFNYGDATNFLFLRESRGDGY